MKQLTKEQRKHLAAQAFFATATGQMKLAAKGFTAAATGLWDGHENDRRRNRPSATGESQDAQLDYGVRDKMASEAKSLTQTFAICNHLMRIYGTYCVGSCLMKWNTGDPAVDRAYRNFWRDWLPMSDVTGKHTFKKQTRIIANTTIQQGNGYGQKMQLNGFGQIRLLDSDRIRTTGSLFDVNEDRVIAGIGLDEYDRRTFARVWQKTRFGSYTNPKQVPWREMFHVFDSDNAEAVVGVTKFHAILNAARDYKETKVAERLASKLHSKLALIVKTVFGGANAATGVDLFQNETATQTGEQKVNVEEIGDAARAYMFPNEEMKAHENNRPSEGWRWLMEDLVREMALGMDLPFSVVYHMAGLGGPAARFEINRAARTFQTYIEDVLEPKWLIPVAGWKISEAIAKGLVPSHPNWYRFKPQRPVFITIDLGRDSKAGIEENRACLLSATSWFEEMGLDFEEETELIFREQSFREEMAKKYGVPMESVRLMTPNGNPVAAEVTDAMKKEKNEATPTR